jgi:hypothetical protein
MVYAGIILSFISLALGNCHSQRYEDTSSAKTEFNLYSASVLFQSYLEGRIRVSDLFGLKISQTPEKSSLSLEIKLMTEALLV